MRFVFSVGDSPSRRMWKTPHFYSQGPPLCVCLQQASSSHQSKQSGTSPGAVITVPHREENAQERGSPGGISSSVTFVSRPTLPIGSSGKRGVHRDQAGAHGRVSFPSCTTLRTSLTLPLKKPDFRSSPIPPEPRPVRAASPPRDFVHDTEARARDSSSWRISEAAALVQHRPYNPRIARRKKTKKRSGPTAVPSHTLLRTTCMTAMDFVPPRRRIRSVSPGSPDRGPARTAHLSLLVRQACRLPARELMSARVHRIAGAWWGALRRQVLFPHKVSRSTRATGATMLFTKSHRCRIFRAGAMRRTCRFR